MPKKSTPEAALLAQIAAGAHEHYREPLRYDYEYRARRDDVEFYRGLATRFAAKRVLELGCGSGRITIPLLADGVRVTGIDHAAPMLARLHEKAARWPAEVAQRLTSHQGDIRSFAVTGRFELAIAAFNVFEHLYTREEFAQCLAGIAARLAPGGHLAFDVQLPDLKWLSLPATRRYSRMRMRDPVSGRPMIYSTNHDYDPVRQISLIRMYYDPADRGGGGFVVQLSQRKFFPVELLLLVENAGFEIVERWGGFAGQPLGPGCENQVIVAKKRRR
ncbi:MAG: class I SAM-dependent methyltransferase [Myxococcales bacterium]|nr:class I SAM-dependent methyltransferase [Myxococcales bacterium]